MLQMHHWASVKDKVGKEKKKKMKEEVKYTDSWNKRCYLEMLNEFSGLYFMFDSRREFWNETKSELQTFLCAVLLRGRWHWVSCSGKGTHYWQRAWSVIPGPGAGRVDSVTHLMTVKGTVSLLCIKMIHILISWMKCTQNTNVEQPYITQIMFLLNNKNNPL